MDEARRARAVVWLAIRPGDYVLARGRHVAVEPAAACSGALVSTIRAAIVLGAERTPTQDLEFGMRQLVEIALRAPSPGINDVFTAVAVIDNVTSALARRFAHLPEAAVRRDSDGCARVRCPVLGYEAMVRAAFDQIRHAGGAMPAVLVRLADAVGRLAPYADAEDQVRALRQ